MVVNQMKSEVKVKVLLLVLVSNPIQSNPILILILILLNRRNGAGKETPAPFVRF